MAEYFKQAAKLRYGFTEKEALKLSLQYDNTNGVVMTQNWVKKVLRGLRKSHESLCLRNPEDTSLTRCKSFYRENVTKFFRNLRELMSRHNFTPNKI